MLTQALATVQTPGEDAGPGERWGAGAPGWAELMAVEAVDYPLPFSISAGICLHLLCPEKCSRPWGTCSREQDPPKSGPPWN